MTISTGLCGRFALGTLSKTYLKDAIFEINVFSKQIPQIAKSKECQISTPKSIIVSELHIILSQLTHVDT